MRIALSSTDNFDCELVMLIESLNAASRADFIAALADIYEHSPWVAEAVHGQRPFADLDALARAMAEAVAASTVDAKMTLIQAHPQLAGKAAVAGQLTTASAGEQRGAGLDRCSPEEFAEITQLNDAYQARFGFPFIIAVKGHTRASIIEAMRQRLSNECDAERDEALRQIDAIAGFRLAALTAPAVN